MVASFTGLLIVLTSLLVLYIVIAPEYVRPPDFGPNAAATPLAASIQHARGQGYDVLQSHDTTSLASR